MRKVVVPLGFLLALSCTRSGTTQFDEIPVEAPDEVADSRITSPRTTVDALLFVGFADGVMGPVELVFPVSEFVEVTGPECDGAPHWHSRGRVPRIGFLERGPTETVFFCDVSELPGECREDKEPRGCGHGKVAEVPREQVQLFQSCLDHFTEFGSICN